MSGCGLILTLGKSSEHVKTSLLRYSPDHLVIITSEDFATLSRRRLGQWKRQFGLSGDVLVIENLFEVEGGHQIMTKTLFAIDILKTLDCSQILLGITGGTMAMAAVAASTATIVGIPIFYVRQPLNNQVIQPMKDVLEFPTINAYRAINSMPPDALKLFIETFGKKDAKRIGIITIDDIHHLEMPKHFVNRLVNLNVIEPIENDEFKITYPGFTLLKVVIENPNVLKLIKQELSPNDAPNTMYV
jgi:hypothetical protein